MVGNWRVDMLGTCRLSNDSVAVTRFRTRRVALLLAHLALFRNRLHFRDEVAELLWPEQDEEVVRRNFRQALSSLRHVLEPPPMPFGSVLQVQQAKLRLNPEAVATDVGEFERKIADARRKEPAEQIPLLTQAVELYQGELLPGFDEEWINQERLRLEDLYVDALRRLTEYNRSLRRSEEAIHYLCLALDKDPYAEEWHVALMSEYLAAGQPTSAIRQFEKLKELLRDHLGHAPSAATVAAYQKARLAAGRGTLPAPPAKREPSETPAKQHFEPDPRVDACALEAADDDPNKVEIRLPLQINRFCGRQEEIERALDQVLRRKARLTSLIGPAGTGKTRLAVEVGRRLADMGGWSVWFVPMADFPSASMVLDATLDTLRARRSGRQDPLDRLEEALDDSRQNLLILDNAEHLIEELAPLVEQMVVRVKGLQILVTSRQSLALAAEHLVPVPPLPVPFGSAMAGPVTLSEVADYANFPSIQLFVDRCQAIRPDFQLTAHNARSVAAICARLEGIPLAIELAAGLSASFAPSQMVFHLQKRLSVLTSRRRDIPARHRSLRAAIDYSYDTLTPKQQRFFAAISVYRGFSIEGAMEAFAEFGASGAKREEECTELIWQLQERSLLRSESSDELTELRFRMLESFREYADELLSEAERLELRARHARYYRRRRPDARPGLSPEERTQQFLWIDSEFENFIAALDFYFSEGDFEACIELLGILSSTWSNRGPRVIERTYIRRIADRAEAQLIDPAARILLLRMLGTTYIRSSEYAAAYRACQIALGIAEANGLAEQITVCYLAIATCAGYLGNLPESLEMSERALQRLPADNFVLRERGLLGVAAVNWGLGNAALAEAAFEQAAEASARARGGEPDVLILSNLARIRLDDGRLDDAMIRLGEAMRISRRLHDEFGLAICLSLVSRYHRLRGQLPAALATGQEALVKFREADFLHYSLISIFQHALAIADTGAWEAATILLAATQGIGKSARLPDQRDHLAALEKIRAHLSESAFERAWARGLAMGTEEAFRLALNFT